MKDERRAEAGSGAAAGADVTVKLPPSPLSAEQQGWVLEARPVVAALVRHLRRLFPWVAEGELEQEVWAGVVAAAPSYDPSVGPFAAFAWWPGYRRAMRTFTREARQRPRRIAGKVLSAVSGSVETSANPDEVEAVCDDGLLRVLFGRPASSWDTGGEGALVAEMERLEVLRALRSVLEGLGSAERRLYEAQYVAEGRWADIGEAIGYSGRHARRLRDVLHAKVRAGLRARGVARLLPVAA